MNDGHKDSHHYDPPHELHTDDFAGGDTDIYRSSIDCSKRTTKLEGIMSYSGKPGKGLPETLSQSIIAKSTIYYDDHTESKQDNATKKPDYEKARELAEEAMQTFEQLTATLAALQQETGKIIKTQDLQREFNKVVARMKVVSKL